MTKNKMKKRYKEMKATIMTAFLCGYSVNQLSEMLNLPEETILGIVYGQLPSDIKESMSCNG